MKTPLSALFMVIAYWIGIFVVLTIPKYIDNYPFNLIWLTMVIPNVLRVIVGNIPRLAVDRGFFFSTTLASLILTYAANKIWTQNYEPTLPLENVSIANRRSQNKIQGATNM